MLGECSAAVWRPDEFRNVRGVGLAPGLELQHETGVAFAVVAGEEHVDPRASRRRDVVFDGDLHVVIDAGPPESVRKTGVLVGPDGAIRGHASGLPLEPVDEPAFQPIEVDVVEEIPPCLRVDDHGREHTLLRTGGAKSGHARRTDSGYASASGGLRISTLSSTIILMPTAVALDRRCRPVGHQRQN